jgi:hypothetical protein
VSDRELKTQFRRREAALRELWNAFDPIGVMDDPEWPRDEYDRYLPHTLRLLTDRAGTLAIAEYVNRVVCNEMALPANAAAAYAFALELEAWFECEESGRNDDASSS